MCEAPHQSKAAFASSRTTDDTHSLASRDPKGDILQDQVSVRRIRSRDVGEFDLALVRPGRTRRAVRSHGALGGRFGLEEGESANTLHCDQARLDFSCRVDWKSISSDSEH